MQPNCITALNIDDFDNHDGLSDLNLNDLENLNNLDNLNDLILSKNWPDFKS